MVVSKRVVIVGGVAGGMSAATRLARLDPTAHVVVLERSGHVSYANCGLPYHVGGVIDARDDLLLWSPEGLATRFGLDVRVRCEAIAIDPGASVISVRSLDSGDVFELGYDALVLSPGADPFVPDIPGIEHALVLRTVEDTDALAARVGAATRALVLGGGFVGVEVAENLVHRGMSVTLAELGAQVLAPLDPELAVLVADELVANGVDVRLNAAATAIVHGPGGLAVTLSDGSSLTVDVVVAAIGVRPSVELARSAGVAIGERGGIVVDERLATSVPGIYAVGDVTEKADAFADGPVLVPLANLANRQGRRVADVISGRDLGRDVEFAPVVSTAIVRVFSLTVAVTGLNSKRARAVGRDVVAFHTHPLSHAGYFPGAEQLALKVLADPVTHRIVGAQAVGRDGVDKRIDVLATAMQAGLPVTELADLELAYAPMFGSAKDPVNQVGYIAENRLLGGERAVGFDEVPADGTGGWWVLDVRTASEFAAGAIPGAYHLPLDELRDRVAEVPADRPVVVVCEVGQRAHVAVSYLSSVGVDARVLDGGWRTWRAGARVS